MSSGERSRRPYGKPVRGDQELDADVAQEQVQTASTAVAREFEETCYVNCDQDSHKCRVSWS